MIQKPLSFVLGIILLIPLSLKAHNGLQHGEAAKGPKIFINNGSVTVNGTTFTQPWKIKPVLVALGGNYIEHDLSNLIYTFNDFGVHIYQYKKGDEANEIQLSFINQSMEFAPTSTFAGQFKVGKLSFKQNTSLAKIQKSLPEFRFTKSYSEASYRGENAGIYIYVNFSDELLKNISYISFGMSGRV